MSRTSSPTSPSTPPSTPPPGPLELYEMNSDELRSKLIKLKLPEEQIKKRSWEDLLGGNLCIGERHSDVAPKKFLIQNMPLFKDSGFTVLFMEHLSIKEHLNLLEEYFVKEEMSHELKTKLNHLDNGHELHSGGNEKSKEWRNYNFTEIVKAAKHNGIKVIPLEESENSWRRVNKREEGMREAVLSLNAKKVIDQHAGSKWLALVGSAHLNTYQGIPGICEIVQDAQDLLITDFDTYDAFDTYNKVHSQSLEVRSVPTDIKWTAEKSSPSTDVKSTAEDSSPSTDVKSTAEDSSPKDCIKVSISLIIDYRSEMSYGAISANESLRPTAQNLSSSSSSSAAAEEDPKGKRGQKQRTETGGVSLLRKEPATKMTMPETTENKSQKIRKLSEQGSGENKGRE